MIQGEKRLWMHWEELGVVKAANNWSFRIQTRLPNAEIAIQQYSPRRHSFRSEISNSPAAFA
jgi:hypothetical protein